MAKGFKNFLKSVADKNRAKVEYRKVAQPKATDILKQIQQLDSKRFYPGSIRSKPLDSRKKEHKEYYSEHARQIQFHYAWFDDKQVAINFAETIIRQLKEAGTNYSLVASTRTSTIMRRISHGRKVEVRQYSPIIIVY